MLFVCAPRWLWKAMPKPYASSGRDGRTNFNLLDELF
jgi:hypothetical protein